MKLVALIALLAACGVDQTATMADDVEADCCSLLPDKDATQACFDAEVTTNGACFTFVCQLPDGGRDEFGVCTAPPQGSGAASVDVGAIAD